MVKLKGWWVCILCLTGAFINAQTPQWNWARGVGGTVQESVNGNYSTINLDSAGNVYELVGSNSASLSFGTFNFTNPRPTTSGGEGQTLLYFVKYSPQGNVLWAKQYRNLPDGYVLPGPNSMFVRPDGTSYLHFSMVQDSIVIGGKVARNPAITFIKPGYCIAQYDAAGNVVQLTTQTKPYGGWQEIMPLGNNQMLAYTNTGSDTINGTPVKPGTVLAILDSAGTALKVISLGRDSLANNGYQPVLDTRYIAINQHSIYLLMSHKINTSYNPSSIPFDSGYTGPLLVKLDTGLNFMWAKPVDNHFGILMATDELDNVYLPFTAQSRDTLRIDTFMIPFPFRYLDHFYSYMGLVKLNGGGRAQWVDTILIMQQSGGAISSVCADRMGNSYLLGLLSGPTYVGPDTIYKPSDLFIVKYNPAGMVKWVRTTENGTRMASTYNCMAEDGHGNIYINGTFADRVHTLFGNDSLVIHPPINNYPLAGDVFLARLGNCNPVIPLLNANGPTSWCGTDSVVLSPPVNGAEFLWNTGDTGVAITARNAGEYSVYVSDTLGCYAQSNTDTVVVYPQPVVHITTEQSGGTTIAIAMAAGGTLGYNYVWNGFISGDTLHPINSGWEYVTVADTNGCTGSDSALVSVVTTINAGLTQGQINLYPNPTTGSFCIESSVTATIKIYNSTGDIVWAQPLAVGKNAIVLAWLAKGIYLVVLNTGANTWNTKVVLE